MLLEMKLSLAHKYLQSNLYDYDNAYILVKGNLTIIGIHKETQVAFKNCVPFTKYILRMKQLTLMLILQAWMLLNLSGVRLN